MWVIFKEHCDVEVMRYVSLSEESTVPHNVLQGSHGDRLHDKHEWKENMCEAFYFNKIITGLASTLRLNN